VTGVQPDGAGPTAAPLVEGAAREWVAESLAEGLGLAERVLTRRGPAAVGEVRALAGAPASLPPVALASRGALEDGVEGSFAGAVAALAALLAPAVARGGRVLVVEDELSPPGDPVLADLADGVFLCDDRVYHWRAVTAQLDTAALTELLGSATSGYPTNGFVTAADPASWGPFAVLAATDLDDLAERVEGVFVAAYDAEGLLWWEPSVERRG
jgi:hypothetical protein